MSNWFKIIRIDSGDGHVVATESTLKTFRTVSNDEYTVFYNYLKQLTQDGYINAGRPENQ